ncbi:hypothetical protein GWI33_016176 [Rhynchophorus ferrugineus]|uniref:Uncharacterized protein n=1 Tax=Rhynchophorus ferrugineus TaxID=354439 RepID=A0A834I199_RHYFE|nr:hypothetical protein GWI33_016176 [Rhynchophorus ferrugineus]
MGPGRAATAPPPAAEAPRPKPILRRPIAIAPGRRFYPFGDLTDKKPKKFNNRIIISCETNLLDSSVRGAAGADTRHPSPRTHTPKILTLRPYPIPPAARAEGWRRRISPPVYAVPLLPAPLTPSAPVLRSIFR